MPIRAPIRVAGRRLAGLVRIACWAALLWQLERPWFDLGGLVSETLRWWQRFVLGGSLVLGYSIGGLARDLARPGNRISHAALLRRLVLPSCVVAVVPLLWLEAAGLDDRATVLASALCALWAGVDIGYAALRLAVGRSRERSADPDGVSPDRDPRSG